MDLLTELINEPINLINIDGLVNYYGPIMDIQTADHYYDYLLKHIEWEHDQAVIMGKRIITNRKVAWYGEHPFSYTYSNTTKTALPWKKELLDLKVLIENKTRETFNACLLNLYHTGSEGMAWHSDGEKDLKPGGAIASLTFGAERKFAFKHKKTKETKSLVLNHGSLLVMEGSTQINWMHRLPPTKTIDKPRINLTFRTIINHQKEANNRPA